MLAISGGGKLDGLYKRAEPQFMQRFGKIYFPSSGTWKTIHYTINPINHFTEKITKNKLQNKLTK